MRPWDLHPIVLSHLQRFFGAARRVAMGLSDDGMASMATFAGNMVWARSADANTVEERRARAMVGGTAGVIADRFLSSGDAQAAAASEALDALEVQLLTSLDPLLVSLLSDLNASTVDTGSPAAVDAFVWQRLFPEFPWPCGQAQLEATLRARLEAS